MNETISELKPLLRELKAKREMSGDRNSGCRSSAALGGSSGGRSSSQGGKGGSGGGKHQKGNAVKKPGWEDAGLEFYREAYPGALENLYDNSLRTLLPSKRYSVGTLGRATVRRRASMRTMRNARRRTQSSAATTLVHTTRRGSDTYLEVMPDLTQGVDEEETWEEMQTIRFHAVSMHEKKRMKRQLLAAPTLRTRGFAAVQLSRRKFTSRLKAHLKELLSKIGIWHGSLRYVEGNFGTGLVAFFTFMKWLLFLNLFSSILIISFIIVPQVLYTQEGQCGLENVNSSSMSFNLPLSSIPPEQIFPTSETKLLNTFAPPVLTTKRPKRPRSTTLKHLLSPSPTTEIQTPTDDSTATPVEKERNPSRKNKENSPKKKKKKKKSRNKNRKVPPTTTEPNVVEAEYEEDFSSSGNKLPSDYKDYKLMHPLPEFKDLPFPDADSPSGPDFEVGLAKPKVPFQYNVPALDYVHDDYKQNAPKKTTTEVKPTKKAVTTTTTTTLAPTTLNIPITTDGNTSAAFPYFEALYSIENNGSYDCCFAQYKDYVSNKEANNKLPYFIQLLVDSIQGTGKIEISYLFYGFYPRTNFTIPELYDFPYRLSLAYLSVMVFILSLSLVLMVKKAARGLRDSLRSSEGQFYQFSNLVFGGWDHCIENNKAATIKKKAIHNELKNYIETEKYKYEKSQRTRKERCRLYFKRLLINIIVIAILGASFFAIFKATSYSFRGLESLKKTTLAYLPYSETPKTSPLLDLNTFADETNNRVINSDSGTPWWQSFLFEFLPSGTIVALNVIVPVIFKFLVQLEKYTPNFILTITLIRTIFLRLASLVVLLSTVYIKIRSCETIEENECVSKEEGCDDQIRCWETYVGQQLYKLTLLDLMIMAINTFFVNLPRKVIGDKLLRGSRIGQAIGSIEFEIPKHVLDIVYGQTLCWLGMFYAPLLPPITCIKMVLVYYIKYFDCAVNTTQSSQLYRTSRSNSLFISILLISFLVTIVPVGFSIVELKPSVSCGPFYNLPTIWNEIIELIEDSPKWIRSILFFLGTAGFAVPAIILLILAAYYYYAVAGANKHMVSLLKHQLVLEGHDKQFLLTRLDKMIKRTRELEDQQRSEMSSELNLGEYSTSVNNDLTLDIRG